MSAQLQVFAEWLLQVAMVIGGLIFVAMCLFGVVDLLGSAVRAAARRGKAWSRMLFYFANRRRIDGWAQEFHDWEMLRSELKSAMERNATKSNTIRQLQHRIADMLMAAGNKAEECGKLRSELAAAVEHCAAKGQELAGLRDLLEEAWGIIANANGADWATKLDDWSMAATRWRDKWLRQTYPPVPSIEARAEAVQARISAEPAGVTVGAVGGAFEAACTGAGKCHGLMKWCDTCGDVSKICDHPAACDAHVEATVGPE